MKKYYGCKKCGNRFKKPEKVIQYLDVGKRILNVCPLCKSRSIVEGYSNESNWFNKLGDIMEKNLKKWMIILGDKNIEK